MNKEEKQYAELQVTSNFSFLRGASHPQELIETAAALGYSAIAITDRNTFAGIVRAHTAAKKVGIRFIPACRIDLMDGASLLAYPINKAAYSSLSNLLSKGNLRTEKGKCKLYKSDLREYIRDTKLVMIPPDTLSAQFDLDDSFKKDVADYAAWFGKDLYLAIRRTYRGNDAKLLHRLWQLSQELNIPLVATNDVHYHEAERRELQDVLTCIREKCTIHTAGFKLYPNAERYLKPVAEMHRLFTHYPDALKRTQEIAEAVQFSLDELRYEYPQELVPEGYTPLSYLEELSWEGARKYYGENIPDKIKHNINHELKLIREMNFAQYFLTVEDIVREARSRGILCQGRGSAANSTICFCLGVTGVDPMQHELLFERFISKARNEPPDIDIDFEHERREEMMQYVYEKYGRDRAAIVATVTEVHYRSAVRDVGKAMGLSLDMVGKLASAGGWYGELVQEKQLKDHGIDIGDSLLKKVLELTGHYMGFPRQLGQHTGGFVITNTKIADLCPLINATMPGRTNIEWNKDDIEALGFLKIDLLSLGMLTCIRKAFDLLKQHHGIEHTLATIPKDDPETYAMICKADTVGVFQIESRAQMTMLPRLKPNCFYDLVIEVALVRPGPIQGDMVHPYLRRRSGKEKVEYPSEQLKKILHRTLGVPLFQEQAMKIAMDAANFTADEADELRRSMATFKAKGMVSKFEMKLIDGMVKNGYTEDFAKRVFRQLEGFGSYGFPESHAASFAHLAYVSAWLKCHYPDVFAAALLNSQPMGFYRPAQIIIDARKHGVEVRPVDVNYSYWDCTLEEMTGKYCALRLGFRQVKGLQRQDMEELIRHRLELRPPSLLHGDTLSCHSPEACNDNTSSNCVPLSYHTIEEVRQAVFSQSVLERLADADAYRSLGYDRREALWRLTTKDNPEALFKNQVIHELPVSLPLMTIGEHVIQDYASMSFSLKAHPVSFLREKLGLMHIVPAAQLAEFRDGAMVRVCGLVLVRQRPGTASGICFMTIEDETGVANIVFFQQLFDELRKIVTHSRLIMVEGKLQVEKGVIHVIAQKAYNFSSLLGHLNSLGQEPRKASPSHDPAAKDNSKVLPRSRDFR